MSSTPLDSTDQLSVQYNEQGLVPGIVQDAESGLILMVAWMNEQAVRQTLETGKATFYSRSQRKIWVKGESSGHVMHVREFRVDCDQDVVLLRVTPAGAACHAGYQSCFYRLYDKAAGKLKVTEKRVFDPEKVYGKH